MTMMGLVKTPDKIPKVCFDKYLRFKYVFDRIVQNVKNVPIKIRLVFF